MDEAKGALLDYNFKNDTKLGSADRTSDGYAHTEGVLPSLANNVPGLPGALTEAAGAYFLSESTNPNPGAQRSPAMDEALQGVGALLLNSIGEGVAIYTRGGDQLWANDFIRQLPTASQSRVSIAARQFNRNHPLIPPGVSLPPDYVLPRETGLLTEDDYRHFSVTVSALPSMGAGVAEDALIIVVTDVSATKKLQQKIAAIDQAGAELMRLDADVVRQYNAVERLKLIEERIVKIAGTLLNFDHFAIRLLDKRDGILQLVIRHNVPPEYDAFIIRPKLEGNGITGYVAASGRTYVCEDITKSKLYIQGVEGAKSSLTVPLRVNDEVIGVMNVESTELAAFDEEDRQLAEIFARYVAMALHMLDLLVVERIATNQTITGRVAHELDEPLQDIAHQVELLLVHDPADEYVKDHLKQINNDLASIRARVKACAAGPQSLVDVEKAMADKAVDATLKGKRLLVADDEQNIRRIINDYALQKGAIVTICNDGGEAIAQLRDNPGNFDIVLSDIRMPDASGYQVFAAARKFCPGVPVILMTGFGYDPHHSIVRAHEEGLAGVLFKPFQLTKLLDELKKALNARTPS
jgi:CheY-like chemotaxis protein